MRIGLSTCATALAGTAAVLLSAPTAHAELLFLPAHERTVTMPDGWTLTVGHHHETADRVAPLNAIGTTREVFVTNQTYGSIGGSGTALQGVVLKTGYHLGCGMDLTGITLGATVNAGITPGVTLSPFSPTGVPLPMPSVTGNIGPTISLAPTFSVALTPGKVVDLPLGEKPLGGAHAFITHRDAHVKIDGCVATASIRSYTIIAAKSGAADDSVAVYGDPVVL